jgi:hypothetical protein
LTQQNRPLNNPPINPQPAAEIPENQEQQPQNPPDSPEVPNIPPTEPTSPVNSPTIPNPPHTLPESSTPALHILSDDSEPDNSSCPIIEERPSRKRKQAPPFPPFLRKKRTRASTRPPFMTTTLDPPPIRLIPRTPPTSPIPGSLPIPATGTETQEPAAQDTVTPSVSNKVAETQEPATHSVAETQEPAIAEHKKQLRLKHKNQPLILTWSYRNQMPRHHLFQMKWLKHKNQPLTQKLTIQELETPGATAETQEPAADIDIEMQESEVEGAETLLSLHQEAETQASAAIPVAAPQEPAHEAMTATQEPVISQSKPTMADVLEENEFLKSQLEAYQQELARAKEAYEKE